MYSYPPQKYKDVLQINDDNLQKNRQRYPNVHNHIKKYSVSLGKIEIKPRIRYHYTSTRRLQLKTVTIPNAREDLEQLRFSYTAVKQYVLSKQYNHFGKLFCTIYEAEAMAFPVVTFGLSWTIRKAEYQRTDALEEVLEKTPESPWTATRSNQSVLKEISLEYSLEGLTLGSIVTPAPQLLTSYKRRS